MKRRKVLKVALVVVTTVLIWNHLPYYYRNDKAVDYISSLSFVQLNISHIAILLNKKARMPINEHPLYIIMYQRKPEDHSG